MATWKDKVVLALNIVVMNAALQCNDNALKAMLLESSIPDIRRGIKKFHPEKRDAYVRHAKRMKIVTTEPKDKILEMLRKHKLVTSECTAEWYFMYLPQESMLKTLKEANLLTPKSIGIIFKSVPKKQFKSFVEGMPQDAVQYIADLMRERFPDASIASYYTFHALRTRNLITSAICLEWYQENIPYHFGLVLVHCKELISVNRLTLDWCVKNVSKEHLLQVMFVGKMFSIRDIKPAWCRKHMLPRDQFYLVRAKQLSLSSNAFNNSDYLYFLKLQHGCRVMKKVTVFIDGQDILALSFYINEEETLMLANEQWQDIKLMHKNKEISPSRVDMSSRTRPFNDITVRLHM